jgi:hypothetical protein
VQEAVIILRSRRQHGVKEGYLVTCLAQLGSHLQGRERRIGFGAFLLLLVEP